MPQLDTSNWLSTFLFTWLTLFMLMAKVTSIKYPPTPKSSPPKTKTSQWTWPW